MKNVSRIIILVAVIIFLVIAGTIFINSGNKINTGSQGKIQIPKTSFVQILNNGFVPNEMRIKRGEIVVWINKSGNKAGVSASNDPTHKLFPFLNLKDLPSDTTIQTLFRSNGNFKYFNRFIPSQTGTVIVTE
jgi:plastocyanin